MCTPRLFEINKWDFLTSSLQTHALCKDLCNLCKDLWFHRFCALVLFKISSFLLFHYVIPVFVSIHTVISAVPPSPNWIERRSALTNNYHTVFCWPNSDRWWPPGSWPPTPGSLLRSEIQNGARYRVSIFIIFRQRHVLRPRLVLCIIRMHIERCMDGIVGIYSCRGRYKIRDI